MIMRGSTGDRRGGQSYMTVSEVAEYLQLSVDTVYMYARTGVIPGTKIGKHWRFSLERLEEWMSRQRPEETEDLRALLVEPEPQVAEAFKTWLVEAGCDVYSVPGREQAFPLLQEKLFDLLMLDLMNPRLGGLETFRQIRLLSPRTEIVVAASHFDADLMNQALDIGPLTVLRKPISKIDLVRLAEAHKQRLAPAEGGEAAPELRSERFHVGRPRDAATVQARS